MQNITLEQIGKKVGLTQTVVCQHFTGSRNIGVKTAKKYADFLNKSVGQIIDMEPQELETLVRAKLSQSQERSANG